MGWSYNETLVWVLGVLVGVCWYLHLDGFRLWVVFNGGVLAFVLLWNGLERAWRYVERLAARCDQRRERKERT